MNSKMLQISGLPYSWIQYRLSTVINSFSTFRRKTAPFNFWLNELLCEWNVSFNHRFILIKSKYFPYEFPIFSPNDHTSCGETFLYFNLDLLLLYAKLIQSLILKQFKGHLYWLMKIFLNRSQSLTWSMKNHFCVSVW